MQEKSIIKQNILNFLDSIGSTPYRYYKETGTTRGVLTQSNGISEDNITRFLVHYPNINPEWLLTGNGEMLKIGVSQPPEIAVSGGLLQEKITFLQEKIVLLQENGVLKDKVIALNDKVIDGLEFKVTTLEKQLVNDSSTAALAPVKSRTLAGV